MTQITKDSAFDGLEDLVDDALKPFVRELTRRLENYARSTFSQLQSHPTLFTNDTDDPPEGPKPGDIWITESNVTRYTASGWVVV